MRVSVKADSAEDSISGEEVWQPWEVQNPMGILKKIRHQSTLAGISQNPGPLAGQKWVHMHWKWKLSMVLGLLLKQSIFPTPPSSLHPTVLHNFSRPYHMSACPSLNTASPVLSSSFEGRHCHELWGSLGHQILGEAEDMPSGISLPWYQLPSSCS